MRARHVFSLLTSLALTVSGLTAPAAASEPAYAPPDQKGPALSVPADELDAALACSRSLRGVTREPVLLVPGTTMDPEVGFAWNYQRAFDSAGIAWCALTLPHDATGDIQVAGEHVVHAVRTMSKDARRKVDVLGWSQGGMVPRWALRFWPDTRSLVDDVIGLSPSNHGTTVADIACQRSCTPANWQQRSSSAFMEALNSHAETFAGISYTVAYTRLDQIVVPNVGPWASSALRTGDGYVSNVALQRVCPMNTADHFAIGSYDAVAYALAMDALTHPGPAVPARVSRLVCLRPFQPGVDLATFAGDYARFVGYAVDDEVDAADVPAEPELAPYVYARR